LPGASTEKNDLVEDLPAVSACRSIPKKRDGKFFNPDRVEGLTEESRLMLLQIDGEDSSDPVEIPFDSKIYDS
jgi:hypothetical protein